MVVCPAYSIGRDDCLGSKRSASINICTNDQAGSTVSARCGAIVFRRSYCDDGRSIVKYRSLGKNITNLDDRPSCAMGSNTGKVAGDTCRANGVCVRPGGNCINGMDDMACGGRGTPMDDDAAIAFSTCRKVCRDTYCTREASSNMCICTSVKASSCDSTYACITMCRARGNMGELINIRASGALTGERFGVRYRLTSSGRWATSVVD